MPRISFHSPLGPLTLIEDDGAIAGIEWGWATETAETGLLALARTQIGEYFGRRRKKFELPLAPHGTDFQKSVWTEMLAIPYGDTLTYGGVAHALATGPRAVGTACGANPIPILIPCHRVIGENGRMIGYSGGNGMATKRYLIAFEAGVSY